MWQKKMLKPQQFQHLFVSVLFLFSLRVAYIFVKEILCRFVHMDSHKVITEPEINIKISEIFVYGLHLQAQLTPQKLAL